MSAEETLRTLETGASGLSDAEASARLARHGPNRLEATPRRSVLLRFVRQFHNVLIYVLLGAAVVVLLLGHGLDAAVIVGVTILNALIGFVQEGRAEQALEAIRELLAPTASVIRAGLRRSIPAADLVPGDLVRIESGDRVTADLRLIEVHGTAIDESTLTGESAPVDKGIDPLAPAAPLAERACMAWAGTLVTRGQASGVVVATGVQTGIGQVSSMVAGVEALETPLTRKLAQFGRLLTVVILVASAAVFAVGILRGRGFADTFLAVVGIAVAAIPEGLPAIVTIALAIGVQRMARRNAIVRRLPSVETLGSVTVICTDKTGTLTRNEMTARAVVTLEGEFGLTGTGYGADGAIVGPVPPGASSTFPTLAALARAAVLCNDASVVRIGAGWRLEGDPTEGALVGIALKAGLDVAAERARAPRVDTVPFESDRRYMATLHAQADATGFMIVKGAPETILGMCEYQIGAGGDEPLQRAAWQAHLERLADAGMRVLAIAAKTASQSGRLDDDAVAGGLGLLGLVGLIDPPRAEAIAAVGHCRAAGIRVKMITGDHALTARAIAREIGLGDGRTVSGAELDGLDPAAFARAAEDADVFARTSPEHKLALVTAMQRAGDVVAMTGDGVNDAPALKRADVGVAMGLKGTAAAKEAAAIVLADDNFASIAHAVEEGRTVYGNIRKAILYILPTSVAEAAVLVVAIVAGFAMPITPVQILWVNMVTTTLLSLVIAFEPPEQDVMRRPPRPPGEPLLSRLLVWRTALVAVLVAGGVIWLHQIELARGMSEAAARATAVNALVIALVFYLFNMRYMDRSSFRRDVLTGNRYALPAVGALLLLQAGFTYLPAMQALFGTAAIDATAWLLCVLVGAAVFVVVEIEKAWLAKSRKAAP